MSVTVDRQVNEKAILAYGMQLQSVVCMEKLAELAKEISKYIRGSGYKDNLKEEMADVYICLDQLAAMYNISENRLQSEIAFKQRRMQKKLEKPEEKKSAELV